MSGGVRDVMWISLDERMFEHLRLESGPEGFAADGLVIRRQEGAFARFHYRIEGDARWRARRAEVSRMSDAPASVVLVSDGKGEWTNGGGQALPELDGCLDLDIQASPFTNTLAIRRLELAADAAAEIRVGFVTVPELGVRHVRQRYTRLADGASGSVYRYESLESDFRSDLPVDTDGLLLEYPGYFRRAGAG